MKNETKLPALIASIGIDAIALLMGQPPLASVGEAAKSALDSYISRRAKIAHDILIAELANGDLTDGDFDPDRFFGLLFRYLNAVKQGAARRNLHLLAQIIRNGSKKSINFEPDLLASNADIASQLRKDEIQLLATMWRTQLQLIESGTRPTELKLKTSQESSKALIPSIFVDVHEMHSVAAALSRTGLVVLSSVYGGSRIDLTRKVGELVKLCDIEAISNSDEF